MSVRLRANSLLVLTAAIWGFAFVAQRIGAGHLGPFAFNGTRFLLGALVLLPVIGYADRVRHTAPGRDAAEPLATSPIAADRWRAAAVPGLVAGVVLVTASWLQQLGVGMTTAGKAGFITGLYVVLVPVIGLLVGHGTGRLTWAGVTVAVVGLYLLTMTEGSGMAPGDALVLVGAGFWAVHILVIDHFAGIDPLRLSVVQFAVCGGISLILAIATEADTFAGLSAAMWPVLYGGLLSVGVAYTLQVVAQRHAKPTHAAIILSTEAVFGAIGGAILLAEQMSGRALAGCALMLAGIVLAQFDAPEVDPAA